MPSEYPRKAPARALPPYVEQIISEMDDDIAELQQKIAVIEQRKRGWLKDYPTQYICRCCGEEHDRPFGIADHNQCGPCWNGIHSSPNCKHPKGHYDHD